jgi:hypothetical protein
MENTNPTHRTDPAKPEINDLERRVLAHERILNTLIAYMSRLDPRILDHLARSFVDPMEISRREQDYAATDDYAEEFIRSVIGMRAAQTARESSSRSEGPMRKADQFSIGIEPVAQARSVANGVKVRERNGIWRVTVDGNFFGDYHTREDADASAALARRSDNVKDLSHFQI